MDAGDLEAILVERAAWLEKFVAKRIPRRFADWLTAEDILQDVWIATFEAIRGKGCPPPRDIERWLVGVAKRKLAAALRSANSLKRGGGRYFVRERNSGSHSALFARVSSSERTPSHNVSIKEGVHLVQIVMAGLNTDKRRVIEMRHFESKSLAEIGLVMNRTEAGVNALLYRAMRQLREGLGRASQYLTATSSSGRRSAGPRR